MIRRLMSCGSLALVAVMAFATNVSADDNAPTKDETVVIESPAHYQVFQRQSKYEGNVLVKGQLKAKADSVQIRFTGKSLKGDLPGEWQEVKLTDGTQFEQVLTVPAGGWYTADVKVKNADGSTLEKSVEKVGVGEVFVGAGQSNSTNSGEFPIKQYSGMVSSFSGENNHWQIADDPQPGVADRSKGGSFWPAFGDKMYEKYGVPIGVATTGFGGTSVNQWQPETDLFKWFLTRVKQLGPNGFRGVLWHQGESDVHMTTEEYYGKLKTVIDASKEQGGWDFPWFVAQVSYHNPENPSFESTRNAHAKIWADKVAFEGPDTDTLVGDDRDLGGKGIHFSPKGLKTHGEMWADKVSVVLDPLLID